ARLGVSANAISVSSAVFAVAAAAALMAAPSVGAPLYTAAALFIPLRLLANLFDGMVAVEEGRATPTGPLFNEVPDRIADVVILAAAGASAGYAAESGVIADWGATLGWIAAVCALLTAYVRELGRALGQPADFSGPFAKQQRMWVIFVGASLAGGEAAWDGGGEVLFAAVAIVAAGTLLTVLRRLSRLAAALRAAA
ncbi:MAG: CDP-alcohol phosphatidyltransferase family protein, partial [Pseudomonadota bacterium]